MALPDYAEVIDPRFAQFIIPNAVVETLGTGFRWLEGPVWMGDWGCLLFNDIPNDRTLSWSRTGGVSSWREPSNYANGQYRDQGGRLITCSHRGRCVVRTEYDGTVTTVVDRHAGKRLNAPNDVVVKSDGTIWFSDPLYGLLNDFEGGRQDSEQGPALYRFDLQAGTLHVMADDFEGPNGLAFSPDERLLYVAETGDQSVPNPTQHIRVFDVVDDGHRLANGRVFHKVSPGAADGFRIDEGGFLWSSAADGVHCISPQGELIGKIRLPATVSNLCFGDRFHSRLFICASHTLFALYINRRGAQRP